MCISQQAAICMGKGEYLLLKSHFLSLFFSSYLVQSTFSNHVHFGLVIESSTNFRMCVIFFKPVREPIGSGKCPKVLLPKGFSREMFPHNGVMKDTASVIY